MKYFYGVLFFVLCLAGTCAAGEKQNYGNPPETGVAARELDRQIDILARQLIGSLDAQKTSKVAVIEFTSLEGNVPGLGKYLAEELTTRLFRTGRFRIVERQLMKKMMEEQKLSASGLVDARTASRFGQVLGVDALLTGTLADLNTSVKINARLIAVETGSVFAVASVKVPMNSEVETLLGRKPAAAKPDPGRFNGAWDVLLACPTQEETRGYTYQFTATVQDGVLHGQYGTNGVAPCLTLDGKINPDGGAVLKATGLTGSPRYTINSVKKGSPYVYHIEASFTDSRGTGKRIGSRACTLTFLKQ